MWKKYIFIIAVIFLNYSQTNAQNNGIIGNYMGQDKCSKGKNANNWGNSYKIKVYKEDSKYFLLGLFYQEEKIQFEFKNNQITIPKQLLGQSYTIYGTGKYELNPNFEYLNDPEYQKALKEIDYKKYIEIKNEIEKNMIIRLNYTIILDLSSFDKPNEIIECSSVFEKS